MAMSWRSLKTRQRRRACFEGVSTVHFDTADGRQGDWVNFAIDDSVLDDAPSNHIITGKDGVTHCHRKQKGSF